MNARALPLHTSGLPTIDDSSVLASADARYAATAALAAINATAGATTDPPAVRGFIDDLAGIMRVRLTAHQREMLETALSRAVDALIVQRVG